MLRVDVDMADKSRKKIKMTERKSPKIDFVGLHAHTVASVFDGLGFPAEHMDFAYENGMNALAQTDHGNMSNMMYQVLHAQKMLKEGKDFKAIFGCEAYFLPSVKDWKEHKNLADTKKKKGAKKEETSGTVIETEERNLKNVLNKRRHLILLAQNQTGLNNLFQLISKSYEGDNYYRFPRMDYEMLKEHNEGIIAASACLTGDTEVETSEGTLTLENLIERIKNKEAIAILSYDEKEKKKIYSKVLWGDKTREDAKLYKIKTKTGKILRLTGDHKVYTEHGWKRVDKLTTSDKLLQHNNCSVALSLDEKMSKGKTTKTAEFVEIEAIEELSETEDVFDITVENTHNFFANDVLVHNCAGGIYAGDYWEHRDEGDEAVLKAMGETTERMLDIFGDRWYAELQWNKFAEKDNPERFPQHEINQYVIEIAKEYNLKLISTADSHYPNPDAWKDRELYKRLGWKGTSVQALPENVDVIGYELYPKNGDEMWESYKKYSEECGFEYDDNLVMRSIVETCDIAYNRIESFMPDNTVRLPGFVVPEGKTAKEALSEMAYEGLKKKKMGKHKDRLQMELDVINENDFDEYFLTFKAIVDIAKKSMLTGPGRGSACGSLLSYCLDITQVNPIKYDLPFERFMTKNQKAAGFPDIDFDVSEPKLLKDILIEEWGDDRVVPISNWNAFKLKSLIKDISKFYNIPFTESNAVTNKMMFEATAEAKKKHGIKAGAYEPTFEEVCEYSPSLIEYFVKHPHIATHVNAIYGSIRSAAKHAGGVVIGENLSKYMPLIKNKDVKQTPWSEGQHVRHLEPAGFIKFDLLGLDTLKMFDICIRHILKRHEGIENPTFDDVNRFYEENLHPDKLNLDDQKVYEEVFHKGNWCGTYQFANSGAQEFCMKAEPRNIVDISAVTSIFRPGPLSADVHIDYVEAKAHPEDITYVHKHVEDVFGETYGFCVFQEQIAKLASKLGKNITLDDGNAIRKALTKKGNPKAEKTLADMKPRFIEGAVSKGMKKRQAEDLWQLFDNFSGYGFSKNHAVPYSIISYQSAWLSVYYAPEWSAAFLSLQPEQKKEKGINMVKSLGFNIAPLSVNESGEVWEISKDGKTLIQPLTSIKGLGSAAMNEINMFRPFETVEEFLFHPRMSYSKLNKKNLDVLVRTQSLDTLMDNRFTGLKHFWTAVAVDRPRHPKDLEANIEKYAPEGDFTEEDKIAFQAELTGVFPISKVMTPRIMSRLEEKMIPPIADYDPDLQLCWFIPRHIELRKTKNKKDYYVLTVIDDTNKETKIKCWGVRKEDIIHVNRPYLAKLLNDDWGFSTRSIKHNFRLLG